MKSTQVLGGCHARAIFTCDFRTKPAHQESVSHKYTRQSLLKYTEGGDKTSQYSESSHYLVKLGPQQLGLPRSEWACHDDAGPPQTWSTWDGEPYASPR